jgi:hypothetical protein
MSTRCKRKYDWNPTTKAYCIVQESKYLIIEHVASLNVERELHDLFDFYGDMEE